LSVGTIVALIGDAPCLMRVSYLMPPKDILVAGCILELASI
jgi:hypothetical protein